MKNEHQQANLQEAEREIKDQAYFIQAITDIMPAILMVVALPSKNIIYNNREMMVLLGFDPEEIGRMSFEERTNLLHPHDLPLIQAYYERFCKLADHEENYVEYRLKNKKGEWIFLSVRGKVFRRDEQGRVTEVLMLGQDVTRRKRSEQEVLELKDEVAQQAEGKYHTLFNSMDEGYCIIQMLYDDTGAAYDWRFIEVNPAFERHNGLVAATGKTIRELVPDIEHNWINIYNRVAETGESNRFEQDSDALQRVFDLYAFRVGRSEERKVAVLFTDITSRRKAEDRQAFLFKLSDGIRLLADPKEILEQATHTARDYFNTDRCYYCEIEDDKVIVRTDASREGLPSVAGTYPLNSFILFKAVIESGQTLVVHNVHHNDYVDPILKEICLQLQILSFINVPIIKEGRAVGILCLAQSVPREWRPVEASLAEEIAERTWDAVQRAKAEEALRASEQQLKQLLKQRDEFIGIASHELKTPVTSMKAYAEIVQESLEREGDAKKAVLLSRLNKQVDRLTSLINDMLDTIKMAEGKLSYHFEPFDIGELLQERIDDMQQSATHVLTLQMEGLPMINADRERIGQVITNFLSNAVKYSPPNTNITVTATGCNNQLTVGVTDEGYGISEEDQQKVFDRFFRVSANKMDTFPGMGLGLYICAQIIRRHGGTIHVNSKVGTGSTFFFTIPYSIIHEEDHPGGRRS